MVSIVMLMAFAPVPGEGWMIFSKVKFTSKYYKAHDQYFLTPSLDVLIRAYEGKSFILKGHYIPMDIDDKQVIILSRYPYSACFFCGGAGPESVAEIHFTEKAPKLKADQVIRVKGRLKLNDRDITHMNFILEEAALVDG
jgi:hypothetical protein